MIIDGIDISALLRAVDLFERHQQKSYSEKEELAAIKTFELCFELSWKTMKRLLDKRGIIVNSPREIIRAAALEKFIEDPHIWFSFLATRNYASHCYDEETADHVVEKLPLFAIEIKNFLKAIGAPQ